MFCVYRGANLCWALGDNLQVCPIFNIGGDEPRPSFFFQVSKLKEEQKKVFSQNGTLFSPNSGEDPKKVFTKNGTRRVARNSQWGRRSPQHSKILHFFAKIA